MPLPVNVAEQRPLASVATIPDQSRADRLVSFDPADFPTPTGREEQWRFTPMDRLKGLHDTAALSSASMTLSGTGPEAITAQAVPMSDPRVGSSGLIPADRVSARAWEAAQSATVLSIPGDFASDQPYLATLHAPESDSAVASHLVIDAGDHSKANIIIRHTGSVTAARNIEIVAGHGANLSVVMTAEWESDTVDVTRTHIRVGRDATVTHTNVALGGAVVRQDITSSFAGPGGNIDAYGVYFAGANQHVENRLFVDHEAPNCRSNVEYKGALTAASAHTVWVGDVLIQADAEGTETYELNRNLLLADGARADSVPNLEIETGQIAGAGHASTTGRFDDEQLFYLQARGIPPQLARQLVIRGFFAGIIGRIPEPDVAASLMDTVDASLNLSQETSTL